MSSHGRGRGLRRNADHTPDKPGGMQRHEDRGSRHDDRRQQNEDHRLSKSDESPIPDTFHPSDLLELINNLTIEKAEDKKSDEVRRITKGIKFLCYNEDSLKFLVSEVHKKSLEDDEFGRKAARAFGNVSQFEVSGIKLRDILLRNIQTDFKNKDETNIQSEQTFLNSVSLLCEVFQHVRLTDGTVINVLSVPILEYCDMLLTIASPVAIDLLGRQLQVIGEEVQRCKPDRFTDILVKVRQMLISPLVELGMEQRCVLLHLLELHLLRWPTLLPDKSGEWYAGVIGQRVLMRRPDLAIPNQNFGKLNGHGRMKEEGLTAEDELVLQRVIQPEFQGMNLGGGTNNQSNLPHNPQDNAKPAPLQPGYRNNQGYYDSQPSRPRSNPEPGTFQTPPPNHPPMPGNYRGPPTKDHTHTPPPGHGNMQGVNRGHGPGYLGNDRGSFRGDQGPYRENDSVMFRGNESNKGFDPNMAPPNGDTFRDAARIAADMMGYRGPPPPHQPLPPAGQGWQSMPQNINAGPVTGIPTAIVPPGVPPMTRPPGASWRDGPTPSNNGKTNWNSMPPMGRSDMPPHRRGENVIPPHEQNSMAPQGRGEHPMNAPRRGDRHIAGSGRIMPTKTPPPEAGGWSNGQDGRGGGWSNGQDGRVGKKDDGGGAFDIGTWNNPGGNEGSGGNGGSSENGSNGNGNGNGNGWKPMGAWSTNDDSSSTSGGGWSTQDGTDAASIGTWENPNNKEQTVKPERNAQNISWNKPSGNGVIGNWGANDCKTPEKQTGNAWSSDAPGSAELSPGSAWKNEPSFAGNWADSVVTPSPRSDQDENPLNISLDEKKSLQRQLANQPNNPW